MRSKQKRLSMDSEMRLMQALTLNVSFVKTFGVVWL